MAFFRPPGPGETKNRRVGSLCVELKGRPLAPGRASGSVVLGLGTARGGSTPAREIVRAVPSDVWATWMPESTAVRAVVVTGDSSTRRPDLGLPAVGGIEPDLLREGDRADVDGDRGSVGLRGVTETPVVTAFLERDDGRVLLLRRSGEVRTFQGRWAGVSGYLEVASALEQARTEVREETGIPSEELTLRTEGRAVRVRHEDRVFVVHPFLFHVRSPKVRLDREHTEAEWVDAAEIPRRATVPKLEEAWEAVARRRALGKS